MRKPSSFKPGNVSASSG